MESEHPEKRREPRYPIQAGASVTVNKSGLITRATTVNKSGSGVLLHFEEAVQLALGDQVTCEFQVSHDADKPLPYWGVGHVVRVEGCCIGIEFKAGVLCELESESGPGATAPSHPAAQR